MPRRGTESCVLAWCCEHELHEVIPNEDENTARGLHSSYTIGSAVVWDIPVKSRCLHKKHDLFICVTDEALLAVYRFGGYPAAYEMVHKEGFERHG